MTTGNMKKMSLICHVIEMLKLWLHCARSVLLFILYIGQHNNSYTDLSMHIVLVYYIQVPTLYISLLQYIKKITEEIL